MSRRTSIAVGLALVLASSAVANVNAQTGGAATEVARAEAFAAQAYDAYSRKDYQQAIELYKKALTAAPSADIIYNIARIYDTKLKDRALAIEFYQRYAQDTGAEANRLRTVSVRLRELRELDAIAGAADGSGAAAELSGAPSAPNASSTAGALSGANASSSGVKRGAGAGAESSGGRATPFASVSGSVVSASRGPQPSAASDRALTGMQVAGIMSGAVGLAGLGLGIGFGLKASSDVDEAKRYCDGNICWSQRGVDATNAANDAATISTIAFVAGGALTLLGVAAVLLGLESSPDADEATTLKPYASRDGAGALLASRW